jgi:DNA-binding transcriptional ArsR family regulator
MSCPGVLVHEKGRPLNREELLALQSAIATILAWPPAVLDEVVRWLSPETAKPNSLDHHPPPRTAPISRSRPAKARHSVNGQTTERKLMAALRERPDQTAGALARSVGGAQTTICRQLKSMGERGAIQKDPEGRWRLAGEEARPTLAPST